MSEVLMIPFSWLQLLLQGHWSLEAETEQEIDAWGDSVFFVEGTLVLLRLSK